MSGQRTIGLDIGGANLKAVHADGSHRILPFALWKQPDQLAATLHDLLTALPPFDTLAVTMTGELCDCFAGKRAGVNAILDAVQHVAGTRPVRVWSLDGFLDIESARTRFLRVASANWHALATCLAQAIAPSPPPLSPRGRGVGVRGAGLLIDIGSTTADIIPLANGQAVAAGATDPERLGYGELVYTGVRRTPLCALLGFEVAAELFATTLDANLLLGFIADDDRDGNTADGRPATRVAAHARLSRMLCADSEMFTLAEAIALSQRALDRQVGHLATAIERVIAAMPAWPGTIILGGSGEFLGRLAWERANRLSPAAQPLTPGERGGGEGKHKPEAQARDIPRSRFGLASITAQARHPDEQGASAVMSLGSCWGEGLSAAACAHALTILSVL